MMMLDYSIVICTYNPDERIFSRCLNAVGNLNKEGLKVEILLIDNNSSVPVDTLNCVKRLFLKEPSSRSILVKEQGLTHARNKGIETSQGKNVIFFDDDNEPDIDYLQVLHKLNSDFVHVAAWGPGRVAVDFIDGIEDKSLETFARKSFQERNTDYIAYSNLKSWQECYPFGTGLCVRADLLRMYLDLFRRGVFSMKDRTGNQMTSGGDTQVVLFCIKQGYAAGVSPDLKMTHMIPGKRTKYDYLKRLNYGAGSCYCSLLVEVFPEHKQMVQEIAIKPSEFSKTVVKKYFKFSIKKNPRKQLEFIKYIAGNCDVYNVTGHPIPKSVKWVLSKLELN
ncbi:glycosyltransferase [Pedobacter sp. ASV1-7]|uniref:glycosyltransferase n=1 Tax=Pedobacter sp. ASV1-7 TaxID=3145237 RepID=UPI0032E87EDC